MLAPNTLLGSRTPSTVSLNAALHGPSVGFRGGTPTPAGQHVQHAQQDGRLAQSQPAVRYRSQPAAGGATVTHHHPHSLQYPQSSPSLQPMTYQQHQQRHTPLSATNPSASRCSSSAASAAPAAPAAFGSRRSAFGRFNGSRSDSASYLSLFSADRFSPPVLACELRVDGPRPGRAAPSPRHRLSAVSAAYGAPDFAFEKAYREFASAHDSFQRRLSAAQHMH